MIPLLGFLPKNSSTRLYTFGILVIPPTNKTSLTSFLETPASSRQVLHGLIVFFKKESIKDSNLALLKVKVKCLGPLESAVRKGRLTSDYNELDNSILDFSAASLTLYIAILSLCISTPL